MQINSLPGFVAGKSGKGFVSLEVRSGIHYINKLHLDMLCNVTLFIHLKNLYYLPLYYTSF